MFFWNTIILLWIKLVLFFKSVIKTIILDIKYIFANKLNLLFLFLLIIPTILASCFLIPIYQAGALLYELSLSIPMLIVFGSIYYKLKKSTIYKNVSMTKNSDSTFYIALYFVICIIGIILLLTSILILLILNQFLLVQDHWGFSNSKTIRGEIQFSKLEFLDIAYTFFVTSLTTFSMGYFFTQIINTDKGYNVLVFILILLCVFFGGTINDFFSYHPIESGDRTFVFEQQGGFSEGWFYPFLILFPFFATGSIGTLTFERICDWKDSVNHPNIFNQNSPEWTLTLIMPFIHFTIFMILGYVIQNIKNKQ